MQRLPLFERLAAGGHGAALDAAALRASIARELGRLLNTRSATAAPHAGLLDYGLPDPTALYPADAEDREALARAILRAIAAFEPRLLAPRVAVVPGADPRSLLVALDGAVRVGVGTRPARFGLRLGPAGASVSVLEEA